MMKTLIVAFFLFFLYGNSRAGDALVAGATYYDSENTLLEVQDLIRRKDTEAIGRLMTAHHISEPIAQDVPIEILLRGTTPSSPAEFRFLSSPTTFWTMSKFVFSAVSPVAVATGTLPPDPPMKPAATPTLPDPASSPTPKPEQPKKSVKRSSAKEEPNIVWHMVDGHKRWYNPHVHHPAPEKPKKRTLVLRAQPAE